MKKRIKLPLKLKAVVITFLAKRNKLECLRFKMAKRWNSSQKANAWGEDYHISGWERFPRCQKLIQPPLCVHRMPCLASFTPNKSSDESWSWEEVNIASWGQRHCVEGRQGKKLNSSCDERTEMVFLPTHPNSTAKLTLCLWYKQWRSSFRTEMHSRCGVSLAIRKVFYYSVCPSPKKREMHIVHPTECYVFPVQWEHMPQSSTIYIPY